MITSHTIVKNEQRFIKPSLLSVIDHVDRFLVWDTGSTDATVKEIKSINSNKIDFSQKGAAGRNGLVKLRNQQIAATKTPWILLLDGDEVWPEKNLIQLIKAAENASINTLALVNRTRNAIGDVYHYLPESSGRYRIGPWSGNLNIRAIKNLPGLKVIGSYPDEAYTINGRSIQDQPERLEFVDTWYLHLTHLKRSGWRHQAKVVDRLKKFKWWGRREKLKPGELPEALST
ncbi:MAG: Glycosyl transferase family 2 [Candidatus Beckwithbacteria bacterium GW2011_GWB1_47_15]|uniref:Glycosyl transferase family 2 n=1 Tax=Candidatus Beckwithbacteria bacterium GW2011_GWB1_47_15 TaxID=1618371 RepID=A0A0G1UVH3_9BACT|nr:MAG: family 2 glycosyl transferase [Candidatus Beckwithbacteria bacterium GW2011_GWC1_49_16]KKU35646.1 MAG: Glycosyl transferase family 2 [Candidatus Beckwithbacteria bacterium GW2011_GWA1_46_30]KKU61700.1 MAG: Glycosyl transferase family 2 [Candidatus Beckwithbacteria bacterium GW2011_GWB1_47_15]KKU72203.1 MAG: Glycosyl transferase family 2 [Candidatus Beckwithbacteria bacterium GW2011_GWA2_47_25]KKW05035.1 MAG: Glycosyl transferase family 2 [Candidatus Beckwithbacteria bacterium GW2011_GWC